MLEGGGEVGFGGVRVGEFEVHGGALDEGLGEGGLQADGLVHVLQSVLVVALEVAKGSAHVVCEGFVLAQVAELESAVEGCGGFGVAVASLGGHGLEALAQLALSALLVQLGVVVKALWWRLGSEALEVVCDECWAGQLLLLSGENCLALGLGNLLQQPFYALRTALVAEAVDDAARRVVEQSLAVALDLLVCVRSSVQGLDVFVVEVDGGGRVFNDLVPLLHGVVAGRAVRVEDGVLLAEDGLAVQFNGAVVVLCSVGLVSGGLELCSVVFALLCLLVNFVFVFVFVLV